MPQPGAQRSLRSGQLFYHVQCQGGPDMVLILLSVQTSSRVLVMPSESTESTHTKKHATFAM
jgi:hypothetical protein